MSKITHRKVERVFTKREIGIKRDCLRETDYKEELERREGEGDTYKARQLEGEGGREKRYNMAVHGYIKLQ